MTSSSHPEPWLGVALAIWLAGCAASATPATHSAATSLATPAASRPRITLAHDTAAERATQQQLARLFDQYDLSPWTFTHAIAIESGVVPHSDPVLTLSTRHVNDDLLLLSTYVHEQSHWYFDAHAAELAAALAELTPMFPALPVGFPDGAEDQDGSYLHLAVNAFEYHALRRLVGELRAREVMVFWADDHYRAIYRGVLERYPEIMALLRRHGLVPAAASLAHVPSETAR